VGRVALQRSGVRLAARPTWGDHQVESTERSRQPARLRHVPVDRRVLRQRLDLRSGNSRSALLCGRDDRPQRLDMAETIRLTGLVSALPVGSALLGEFAAGAGLPHARGDATGSGADGTHGSGVLGGDSHRSVLSSSTGFTRSPRRSATSSGNRRCTSSQAVPSLRPS
jgi:hypothetical protein